MFGKKKKPAFTHDLCPSCHKTYGHGEMPDYWYTYECPQCGATWKQVVEPVCDDCGKEVQCSHCNIIPTMVMKSPAGIAVTIDPDPENEPCEVTFITLTALHRKAEVKECSRRPMCPFLHHDNQKAHVDAQYSCRLFGHLQAEMWGTEHHVYRNHHCVNGGLKEMTDG
jgi:predicted nucleic acid-binding Zn ribbon protein